MAKFGRRSKANLSTCDNDLQKLFNEVVKYYDCSVICGHRDEDAQNEAFYGGRSKLKYPRSRHNSFPSRAVDVAPYYANSSEKIPWNDKEKFVLFAGFVLGIAANMGIRVRWGGDFNMNWDAKDQSFFDGPHFELLD